MVLAFYGVNSLYQRSLKIAWVAITNWLIKALMSHPSRFAKEYSASPGRGYGNGVIQVLKKLSSPQLTDVYQPARAQFNGRGSFGNGGAMRAAPFALAFPDLLDVKRVSFVPTSSSTLKLLIFVWHVSNFGCYCIFTCTPLSLTVRIHYFQLKHHQFCNLNLKKCANSRIQVSTVLWCRKNFKRCVR